MDQKPILPNLFLHQFSRCLTLKKVSLVVLFQFLLLIYIITLIFLIILLNYSVFFMCDINYIIIFALHPLALV